MEDYIVSARKYRPSTFASVVGQQALTATLKNAVATNRLAHSYLFCGSRGVGKTSCARIFAKTINCENISADGEACNECESCRAFNNSTSLNIIELDAASNNGIDAMKELIDQVQVPPSGRGRYRVFIIDEVHMLSTAAFNAFLKTLEEPPKYVVFILATTEKHKIIPTILSRCQIYDFHRITITDIVNHLKGIAAKEGIEAEESALGVIARKADGAMRDALSIFDQVAASSRNHITYAQTIENLNMLDRSYYVRLLDMFLKGDVLGTWMIYREVRDRGFESQFFINGLGSFLRDLMMATATGTLAWLEADNETRKQMAQLASKCVPDFLIGAMNLCNEADLNYRVATNKQFLIELTLAKICQLFQPDSSSRNSGAGKEQALKPIAAAPASLPSASAAPVSPHASQQYQTAGVPPSRCCESSPSATPYTDTSKASQPSQAQTPQSRSPQSSQPISPPEAGSSHPSAAPSGRPPVMSGAPGPRISIKNGLSKPKETQQAPTVKSDRREPYTDTDLEKAWEQFIADFPKEHILVNTMRLARPKPLGDGLYMLPVASEPQQASLHEAMPRLLQYLRDALKNDALRFDVRIVQGADVPQTWNDREAVAHMIEANPILKDFINDFQLTF